MNDALPPIIWYYIFTDLLEVGESRMAKDCQCSDCGEMVEYLVDDGICENCFKKRN